MSPGRLTWAVAYERSRATSSEPSAHRGWVTPWPNKCGIWPSLPVAPVHARSGIAERDDGGAIPTVLIGRTHHRFHRWMLAQRFANGRSQHAGSVSVNHGRLVDTGTHRARDE